MARGKETEREEAKWGVTSHPGFTLGEQRRSSLARVLNRATAIATKEALINSVGVCMGHTWIAF